MALVEAVSTPDPQAVAEHRAIVIPDDREPIEDAGSLSDHEAQFGPGAKAPQPDADEPVKPRADDGRFQPRHRAKSQQASADDVAEIKTLTGKLRGLETELGKVDPDALNGAARVLALKRQIRGIEAHIADKAPKPAPIPQPIIAAPAPVAAAPVAAKPVAEKFAYPTFDQALTQNPNLTYEDWQDARDDAKYAWRADLQRQQTAREQETQQQRAAFEAQQQHVVQLRDGYLGSLQTYLTQHPDRRPAFEAVPDTPPLMNAAIMTLANGPDVVYRLRQQSALFHEAALFAYDKPVTDATVALMQRWLEARVLAGTTGAAATPTPVKSLPSPPTPVRTGSNLSSGTTPPGDGASLAEHESFFHKRRR